MPATARPIPPTAPRQHLGTMALCFYNAPTLDTESADVTVTMKTLLNLLLIEGPPVSSYRRSFSSPLPRQNLILPGPREDGNSMTFNNASAAPLLHILGHGIMYNVQSIKYKVRSCCSLCEDGQGRCRVLAADVDYTMVVFCQPLAAAQTVALCLQIQSENILGHKSE